MDFIAYDLETTGIEEKGNHIIEIGAVRFENFKPTTQFNRLVKPPVSIPADSIAIHGITDEMVAKEEPVENHLNDFADFCGDSLMVAHNAGFDFNFLKSAIKLHKKKAPTGVTLDTKSLTKRVITGLPSYRLSALTHHFKIESTVYHRAAADAEYCGRLFAEIIQILQRNNHPTDIDALLELTEKKAMRFPQIAQEPEQLGLF